MEKRAITAEDLESYALYLKEEEKGCLTVEKYMRDLRRFCAFLEGRPVTKELVIAYKEQIVKNYAVSSVNSMLAALNRFFDYAGWEQCRVKQLRRQKEVYCREEKELSKGEYLRLIRTAGEQKKERLSLVLQTLASTGIRVSELEYITVKAVRSGVAQVDCKGKHRPVILPSGLREVLSGYIGRKRISRGPVFVTRGGAPLNRSNLWREMKNLCRKAGVSCTKVFPHNFRRLFARMYYKMEKDIAKLADLLGHSSVDTTRIYIISTGFEHRAQIERMGLVIGNKKTT